MDVKEGWERCVEWMSAEGIVSADNKIVSCRSSTEFASYLRDGVLLCGMLNQLKEAVLDGKEFSLHPQTSQFLCNRNLKVFLQKCRTEFDLRQDDLFTLQDMNQPCNVNKVLNTISVLSKSQKVSSFIRPFLLSEGEVVCNQDDFSDTYGDICSNTYGNTPTNKETDIYTLKETSTHTTENTKIHTFGDTNTHTHGETNAHTKEDSRDNVYQNTNENDIYDDLCSVRKNLTSGGEVAPKSRRDLCIQELVVTERKYVEALRMIKLFFMNPLQNDMSATEHRKIFHGVERLWQTHLEFEKALKSSSNSNGEMLIADCFIANKERFIFYGDFCSNLTTSQQLLDTLLNSNPALKQKVQDCETKAVEGKFRLRDLLALPMQRILKYNLFLKEMIKNSEEKPSEKVMLQKAFDEIQDLSLFINEVTRDNETINSMYRVQASIPNLPASMALEECGRFKMDADLKVKSSSENSTKNRHVFLFDMVILICKDKNENGQYSLKDSIRLAEYKLDETLVKEKGMHALHLEIKSEDTNNNNSSNNSNNNSNNSNNNNTNSNNSNNNNTNSNNSNNNNNNITFLSKKVEVINTWTSAVKLALDNINPEHSQNFLHHFVMASFGKPTICDVCRKLLRGVFYQGYRCNKTKMAVHKDCIFSAKIMKGPPTCSLPPRSFRSTLPSLPPNHPPPKVKALQSYTPSPNDPPNLLPFSINDVIRVVSINDDDDLFEGELEGRRGFVSKRLVRSMFQAQRTNSNDPSKSLPSLSPRTSSTHSPILSLSPFSSPVGSRSLMGDDSCDHEEIEGLNQKLWYVGRMCRDEATVKLWTAPFATYLVRMSVGDGRKGQFALSIKLVDTVEHLKICSNNGFYFSNQKTFTSITNLVEYYQTESVENIFTLVRTPFLHPFYSIFTREGDQCLCMAIHDFESMSPNQVTFLKGDTIEVVSKAGESTGWWKGSVNNKVGYFPVSYVKQMP